MTPISTHTLPRGPSARLVSGVAALVLSLATGTPLRSVPHLMPHSGEQGGPYLGL
ncbi:hypothetical protein [Methylobacterium haplocladii]|uniref:Uncharacterized protein n=1 Tax=Methylobacterium haplocladii TaxID=1176176 RepID=A0A512IQK5_9HYPH|nr:hypothetical protein [Methylobacterium haplocladii]GEO99952.1 hypothetical protein MHA02_23400 [Methylobacterium haplocladii]GJD86221.1 hypothetical protein HPGCJGGD_4120 [Methylobacterium haplocladii]GLS59666.1 hypothetical protein GCM10007887_23350 [Methylobacterium haplocladii]